MHRNRTIGRYRLRRLMQLASMAVIASPALAADKYWVGADGLWNDPSWSGTGSSGAMAVTDTGLSMSFGMLIGNGGTGQFTQTGGGTSYATGVTIASSPSSSGTYTLNSGTLVSGSSSTSFIVGLSGVGIF